MAKVKPKAGHKAAPGRAGLVSELGRLDPWSYWTIPVGSRDPGDLIVVGATGAYLVFVDETGGYLEMKGRSATVGGRTLKGFRGMRKAAIAVGRKLSAATVSVQVEPILCLTMATAGAPRTVKGVRLVQNSDIAADISKRPRKLEVPRAQRAARVLGMQLAGDQKRHFVQGS